MKTTKPVSADTRAMLDEMEEQDAVVTSEDKLELIRSKVRELREKELDKSRIAESLKSVNIEINDILFTRLPQIMDENGVPKIGIAADGNKPPYEVVVGDYYKANIPDEHEQDAYALLRKMKSEDLIKTTFTIEFGLREAKAADRFRRSLNKAGIPFSEKCSVPWNTLTAWFRVQHNKKPLTARAMALLGAKVGRVAKVVTQKEKK